MGVSIQGKEKEKVNPKKAGKIFRQFFYPGGRMGMFDIVRWSGNEYQTKDLYNQMTEFWITPKGELYEIDYSGTTDFVMDNNERFGYRVEPNGNRGRVKPVILNINITMYNENEELTLHIFDGKLKYLS